MNEAEGVIKFRLDYEYSEQIPVQEVQWQAVQQCRDAAFALGVVGQDEVRYEGYGFGNVSVRVGQAGFVISGTQTGGVSRLSRADYAYVEGYDLARNSLQARGACKPSSEAMTHAALYDVLPQVNAIIHGHHAGIWQNALALGLWRTAADVPYGTPEMATAMQQLVRSGDVSANTLVMLGHLDGFITWGESAEEVVASVKTLHGLV